MKNNPLGCDGFEFVEFCAPNDEGIQQLDKLFTTLGFIKVGCHKRKKVTLYRQGEINFIVNAEHGGFFHQFATRHGPSACAMAFHVASAESAYRHALEQGAKPFEQSDLNEGEAKIPAIYGIGDSVLYFVDTGLGMTVYENDFDLSRPLSSCSDADIGLTTIDHLTHNVNRGEMDRWAEFYKRIGNFKEIRYFDIEGKLTGLTSRAMTSPCGKIRIPINESADDKSQIEEFIRSYNGEGIQHIALTSTDIYTTVRTLKERGITFMTTPDTYYERVDQRVPGHGEPLDQLKAEAILIDGDGAAGKGETLLQIFTDTVIGPIFFEIIQRKGNEGFGEGNFQALFDSIEEDQIRRGVLEDPGEEGKESKK